MKKLTKINVKLRIQNFKTRESLGLSVVHVKKILGIYSIHIHMNQSACMVEERDAKVPQAEVEVWDQKQLVVLQTTQEFKGTMETLFLETCKRWLEEIEICRQEGRWFGRIQSLFFHVAKKIYSWGKIQREKEGTPISSV